MAAPSQSQSGSKAPAEAGELQLIKDIRAIEHSMDSPHTMGELIRAHTASGSAALDKHQPNRGASDFDLDFSENPTPTGGSDTEDGPDRRQEQQWGEAGFKRFNEQAVKSLARVSPNKVTGFINPMYSNQDGKGGVYEQNPIFEM